MLGTFTVGEYTAIRVLSTESGQARVYLAKNGRGIRVVLRIIPLPLNVVEQKKVANRLQIEAERVKELNTAAAYSDYIVRLDDFFVGECFGHPSFIMVLAYCPEGDLSVYVKSRGRISIDEWMVLGDGPCYALHLVHGLGVLHMDIKPQNFLVWSGGARPILKLTDFGIMEDPEISRSAMLGTGGFHAPELGNPNRYGPETDLFSLGAVMYWVITGQTLFPGAKGQEYAIKLLQRAPIRAISDIEPKVKDWPGLEELVSELLAYDPQERPQSALGVMQRLEQIRKDRTDVVRLREKQAAKRERLKREQKAREEKERLQKESIRTPAGKESLDLAAAADAETVARVMPEAAWEQLDVERKAEADRVKLEAERKAEADRVKLEAERKAEADRVKLEAERKAEADRVQLEAERKAEADRAKLEAERKADADRKRAEAERKVEADRLSAELAQAVSGEPKRSQMDLLKHKDSGRSIAGAALLTLGRGIAIAALLILAAGAVIFLWNRTPDGDVVKGTPTQTVPQEAKPAAAIAVADKPPPAERPPGVVQTVPQEAKPKRFEPADGLRYAFVRAGVFRMGCSAGDGECYPGEKPGREVTISKGFWMGESEVTQRAYQAITGNNPSHFKGGDLPVETVSWTEASAYCRQIGGRLPTEAEWEYAARGGDSGSRYGELERLAWYSENSGNKSHPVKQKQANGYGLYDMLGNVWEWTGERYAAELGAKPAVDPQGPPYGQERSLRGGSWDDFSRSVRASNRLRYAQEGRSSDIGFRCVGDQ